MKKLLSLVIGSQLLFIGVSPSVVAKNQLGSPYYNQQVRHSLRIDQDTSKGTLQSQDMEKGELKSQDTAKGALQLEETTKGPLQFQETDEGQLKSQESFLTPLLDSDTVALTSGVSRSGSVPAPERNQGLLSSTQYTIQVPSNATQLRITLSGNQDVDLFARFGQRVAIENGSPIADHRSTSTSSSESITINNSSSPSLKLKTY